MSLSRLLAVCLSLSLVSAQTTTYYVDCNNGNDSTGDGSAGAPWQTPMRARDGIRKLQPLTQSASVLFVQSSPSAPCMCYPRSSGAGGVPNPVNYSLPILILEPQDSGVSSDITIAYTAAAGADVRFLQGVSIPSSSWVPVSNISNNPNIQMANLNPLGNIADYGFGHFTPGGLGTCAADQAELFFDNKPMVVARYPNIMENGTFAFIRIETVPNASTFTVSDPQGRLLEWGLESDPWAEGFWTFGWADSHVQFQGAIRDPKNASNTLLITNPNTPPVYGFSPQASFFGENLLSELDQIGEYYLDKVNNLVYFYPPITPITVAQDAFLSMGEYGILGTVSNNVDLHEAMSEAKAMKTGLDLLANPVSGVGGVDVSAAGHGSSSTTGAASASSTSPSPPSNAVSFVTISGITIAYARNTAVSIPNGFNFVLQNVTMTNGGHNGFSIAGTNNIVLGSEVSYWGCAGSSMYGGDETHLIPGNNLVADTEFYNYSRITRCYNPGIGWGGVGNTYSGNYIHDAPHNGMLGGGNNNLFQNNRFDTLTYEVTDSGTWYAGRSWVRRGNVILNNTFENIQTTTFQSLGYPSVQAIYLDDQLSGTIIINNTFINCNKGSFVGGGRDTVISGNTYIACGYAVHIDNRGMNWQADSCAYNSSYTGALVADLFAVNYTLPPYSTNYPPIVDSLSYHPCIPVNISVVNNRYCNLTSGFIDVNSNTTSSWYDDVNNNVQYNC